MKHLSIIILFFGSLLTCCGQTITDTLNFKQDIPVGLNNEPIFWYERIQQKVNQLNIDSLPLGYDSLQIRVWYWGWKKPAEKLLILKCNNGEWGATSFTMTVNWNASELSQKIISSKIDTLTPKNGWENFTNRLFKLNIKTLPNMHNIPGLEDNWHDGHTYNVEFANSNIYRFYSYHVPEEFQNKYLEAKNMVRILKLIEKEFGIAAF